MTTHRGTEVTQMQTVKERVVLATGYDEYAMAYWAEDITGSRCWGDSAAEAEDQARQSSHEWLEICPDEQTLTQEIGFAEAQNLHADAIQGLHW